MNDDGDPFSSHFVTDGSRTRTRTGSCDLEGRTVVGGSATALGRTDLDSAIQLQMQMAMDLNFFHNTTNIANNNNGNNTDNRDLAVVDDGNHDLNAMNVGDLSALFAATANTNTNKNDSGGTGVGSGHQLLRAGLQPQQTLQQHQHQHQQQQQHGQNTGMHRDGGGGGGGSGGNNMNDGQTGLMRSTATADSMNMEALQQLLALSAQTPMAGPYGLRTDNVVGPSGMGGGASTPGAGTASNAAAAALLEQQIRLSQLQQLQQLQQQIFQQQIEIISGQAALTSQLETSPFSTSAGPRDNNQNQFHGLPTPANSTEIRAQPTPNFVPPMFLQQYPQNGPFNTPNPIPQGPSSAPAHLAFPTHTPLASPSDLDFELESPWLGATTYGPTSSDQQDAGSSNTAATATTTTHNRRGSKRGASSSGEDVAATTSTRGSVYTRKRQSPAIRSTASGSAPGSKRAGARASGTASLSSTPAMRASRPRRASIMGEIPGDTPSPVDLSMPPPAPPIGEGEENKNMEMMPISSGSGATLAPVTPASIMNLGHLGLSSGLSPPPNNNAAAAASTENAEQRAKSKSKSPPKVSNSSGSGVATGVQRPNIKKTVGGSSLISPSLKPLLPGGLPPASAAHLATASNYSHHLSGSASALNIAPGTALPQPTPAIRKTSHKAAEQKRRDSLKSSFDALRMLLPPLPLPSDENYDGEPPLPGAMPPRGPPRGDATGPNRAVSKLQLLRCGNDYIRRLKERVGRRDEYIELLKAEVRVLRSVVREQQQVQQGEGEGGGEGTGATVEELMLGLTGVDLEKDIDAEEANAPRLGGAIMENEDEEDGE